MRGIGQLFKGVLIGLVILLAIIGLINISGTNDKPSIAINSVEIPSPTISINSPSASDKPTDLNNAEEIKKQTVNSEQAPEENPLEQSSLEQKNSLEQNSSLEQKNSNPEQPNNKEQLFKPEIVEEPKTYGILKLTAKQSVDYHVYNQNNKLVASSSDNSEASFRLETGTYKVLTVLGKLKETQTITITSGKTLSKSIAIQAPITSGVLQVSALSADDKKRTKTNFIIENLQGKQVASRHQVSSTLFKLKAGTYKITANNEKYASEIRTVTIEANASLEEVFILKTMPTTEKPPVEIATIEPQKTREVVTKIEKPEEIKIPEPSTTETQIPPETETVVVVAEPAKDITVTKPDVIKQGLLKVNAISASTKQAVKSNFYVQTTNGKHIARQIYKNSASFKLDEGSYKITIKSKNMKTISKVITITAKSKLNRIFALHNIAEPSVSTANSTPSVATNNSNVADFVPIQNQPTNRNLPNQKSPNRNAPLANIKTPLPATGSLIIQMQPAKNLKTSRNNLLSDFIIKTKAGKRIATLNKVQHATVKLDVGEYVVTTRLRGRQKSKHFTINKNNATRVSFSTSEFRTKTPPTRVFKGVLRSRIVNTQGRPIKGNLIVSNLQGQVVHRANNVSIAEFQLPAKPYTISILYQGLSGSERVNIIAGETTVQTFTVADQPQTNTRSNRNTQRRF